METKRCEFTQTQTDVLRTVESSRTLTARLGLFTLVAVLAIGTSLAPVAEATLGGGSAQEASTSVEEGRKARRQGADGVAVAEPGKHDAHLEFRIAPKVDEVGSHVVAKYKQMLAEGAHLPGDKLAWFEVRADISLAADQITCERDGKAWLLLWNDKAHVMLQDGTWQLEEVLAHVPPEGNRAIILGMDAAGAQTIYGLREANLQHYMAVMFEGRVIAVPLISTSYTQAGPVIPLPFSVEEVERIATILKKDLPVPPPPANPPQELSGRVVDPNGRPAAGAQVGLDSARASVAVHNGLLEANWCVGEVNEFIVVTDAEGRFRFADTPDEFILLATHESGFALLSDEEFKKNHEIRLERWGRIEGQLAQGRGGPDRRVWMLGLPTPAWLGKQREAFHYDTPYGTDGRFVFEKVPAGWFEVGYLVVTGDDPNLSGFTSRTPVQVKAGASTRMRLGGQGRTVVGRFVAPASYGKAVYFGAGLRVLRRHEKIERRESQGQQTPEREEYMPEATPCGPCTPCLGTSDYGPMWCWCWSEGSEDNRRRDDFIWSDVDWRGYAFRIRSDGSFRIEDVTPGQYELHVSLEREDAEFWERPFATYRGTIEVPSLTGTDTDQPLDVGELTLDVRGVGDPAPLFEAETVDGQRICLSDYQGRFVLLTFWEADACSRQEDFKKMHKIYGDPSDLDRLRELHKTYGGKGSLQIIGINESDTPETIRRCVAERHIPWPEIRCDTFWNGSLRARYNGFGVATPCIVLVDRAGKIAAVNLQGERLVKTVGEVLEHAPTPVKSASRE